jgi:hypothetical protein
MCSCDTEQKQHKDTQTAAHAVWYYTQAAGINSLGLDASKRAAQYAEHCLQQNRIQYLRWLSRWGHVEVGWAGLCWERGFVG